MFEFGWHCELFCRWDRFAVWWKQVLTGQSRVPAGRVIEGLSVPIVWHQLERLRVTLHQFMSLQPIASGKIIYRVIVFFVSHCVFRVWCNIVITCPTDLLMMGMGRDQPNSREKMHDFMAEFLKCVKFHGKFTERVSQIHGPHRHYFEVLRYCKQRNFRTTNIYYTKSRLKTVNVNYLVLKCDT